MHQVFVLCQIACGNVAISKMKSIASPARLYSAAWPVSGGPQLFDTGSSNSEKLCSCRNVEAQRRPSTPFPTMQEGSYAIISVLWKRACADAVFSMAKLVASSVQPALASRPKSRCALRLSPQVIPGKIDSVCICRGGFLLKCRVLSMLQFCPTAVPGRVRSTPSGQQ